MANVTIDIAAQFTGKTAFNKAQSSTTALEKSVSKLGKRLLAVYSTQKLIAYGKASAKAFAADDKAARSLALALANTGNAFASIGVEKFIADLQKTTGVLDDNLRPAFRTLLTATGDVKKSQDGLNLALDISAGTGKDLSAVSMALAKAYGGQTTALSRLGAGLSKATLASGNMDLIISELSAKFKGQALTAAKSYSGQLDQLTVAAQNAKEIIGKDLLDSLNILSGPNGIGKTTSAIENLATTIGNAIFGVSILIEKIKSIYKDTFIGDLVGLLGKIPNFADYGAQQKALRAGKASPGSAGGRYAAVKDSIAQSKLTSSSSKLVTITKAQLAAQKKITNEKLKQKALDIASSVANQAGGLFDIDKIELAAAAMNKQTEEDKVRIRLKQEIMALDDAINSGNVAAAAAIGTQIQNDAKLLGMLRGDMMSLNGVPNPFIAWLKTLNDMVAQLQAAVGSVPTPLTFDKAGHQAQLDALLGSIADHAGAGSTPLTFNPGLGGYEGIGSGTSNTGSGNYGGLAGAGQAGGGGMAVTVNVAGSVTSERDLVAAITQGIYNNQASGTPVGYSTQY
jgi:hypothetical protein